LHHAEATVSAIVWWTLAAPVLLLPQRPGRRVLLLGLGGGSAARAIRALDPAVEIVGVERDVDVIHLAKLHFGLDQLGVEVVVDDAFRYLEEERRRFDLVIDDVFVGSQHTIHKPPQMLETGYPLVRRRLKPGGILAANTIHETAAVARALRRRDSRLLSVGIRGYWNQLVLSGRGLPDARTFRQALHASGAFERLLPRISVRALQ
jgi:spermidine synthase